MAARAGAAAVNLLHVIPYYAPAWSYGGVVRAAADLTRAQAAAGHRVFVLTTDALAPGQRMPDLAAEIDSVSVVRVRNVSNALRARFNFSTPVGLGRAARRLLDAQAIDVVHCHELRTVENLLAAPVAQARGVPVVVSPHGTLTYATGRARFKQSWDRTFAGLLRRFDRVIALTEDEAAEARALWAARGVPLAGPAVVPNGIHLADFARLPDPAAFRARWDLGPGPVVLFLGRLHARKGLQFLIPAFAQIADAIPDARLVLAGPDEGMRASLDAQIARLGLADRVIFTGMLTGEDKLAALAAADLFTLPAEGEGFSMAVLEAMACGLPVLLTPGCHFPEAARAGAGLVVAREPDTLAEGLRALLTDAERRASMGRRARALVEARYTWPQVVARLDEAYEEAISHQRSAVSK